MILSGLAGVVGLAQSADGSADRASQGSAAAVATEVAGAVEEADTTIVPASIDHLAVVRVSVTRCGERAYGSGVRIADGLVRATGWWPRRARPKYRTA